MIEDYDKKDMKSPKVKKNSQYQKVGNYILNEVRGE